jgi:hypothetical protein
MLGAFGNLAHVAAPWLVVPWMILSTITGGRINLFRCPRCGELMFRTKPPETDWPQPAMTNPFRKHCPHCGLRNGRTMTDFLAKPDVQRVRKGTITVIKTWEFELEDGKHTIVCEHTWDSRRVIWLDKKKVIDDTVYSNLGYEYTFNCGGHVCNVKSIAHLWSFKLRSFECRVAGNLTPERPT